MATDVGVESLLGDWDADDLAVDVQTARDRLVLATRYLANWYAATKDSDNKAIWWQKIDDLRTRVEAAYAVLSKPENTGPFPHPEAKAAYQVAALAWPGLWREITLSGEVNIHFDLIDQAADLLTTIAHTPGAIVRDIGNEVGKAVGGAAGNLLRWTWPYLILAGALGTVYIFRAPILKWASKVGG
jgi:hypothetical protein